MHPTSEMRRERRRTAMPAISKAATPMTFGMAAAFVCLRWGSGSREAAPPSTASTATRPVAIGDRRFVIRPAGEPSKVGFPFGKRLPWKAPFQGAALVRPAGLLGRTRLLADVAPVQCSPKPATLSGPRIVGLGVCAVRTIGSKQCQWTAHYSATATNGPRLDSIASGAGQPQRLKPSACSFVGMKAAGRL